MKIQSNGMGMQSVAMYLMSSLGILPRFDYSIFADPGAEKESTYKYLEWLKKWQKNNDGIPIIHDTSKNLYEDLLNVENSTGQRFASIPGYTLNEDGTKGMLRRQCTHEYKIIPVLDQIRKLQGKKKGQTFDETEIYLGISIDEVTRIAKPERKNLTFVYPFCNIYSSKDKMWFGDFSKMSRGDLIKWLSDNDFRIPDKSACVFCPFQHDRQWLELKQNGEWDQVIKIDNAIRDSTKKGIKQKMFLHNSCKPINEVDFNENQIKIDFNCGPFCEV